MTDKLSFNARSTDKQSSTVHNNKGAEARNGGRERVSARPDGFAQSAVDEGKAGAPSSNTAPANCTEISGTRILRVGVDTLFLSYPGDLLEEVSIRLETLKQLAQSKNPESQRLAQHEIAHHLFKVHDRGRHPYAYILSDRWYRIQLSKRYAEHTPLAYIRAASEPLTFEGPSSLEKDLHSVVSQLGTITGPPTVGWVDLCVDFVTDVDLEAIDKNDWVTRARKFATYHDKRRYSGLTIGQGGDLMARLYNKTLEMHSKPREYLEEIWKDLGWNPDQEVWRLEFQFRRNTLRSLGVTTFDELLPLLGGLWKYATEDWLRLTHSDPQDKTKSRWPTHSMWEILQKADWGVEQKCNRKRPPSDQPPSDKSLFINGISGITSFMAREGFIDIYSGAQAYIQDARKYHTSRQHFTKLSFEDYVNEKVQLKARRFGTMKNLPEFGEDHPADEAVASEYRRRSNGK